MLMIGEPTVRAEENKRTLTVSVWVEGERHELFFRVSGGPIRPNGSALLAACLLPAMSRGVPVQTITRVSRDLHHATDTIQDIYRKWFPEFQKVRIETVSARSECETERRSDVGCFFSGGVDSFYTLLKRRGEITTLVTVYGFDIRLDDHPLRAAVSAQVSEVAREFNKKVLEVETNLRDFSDLFVDWGLQYFGSAMASVALLLSGQLRKIFIPSSESYAHLDPCGSHPLVDPLWSSEGIDIVHDGCEATRIEKAAKIAESEVALRALRVCHENRDGLYNCGRCEKCIRTMINLLAVGALDRCTSLPRFDPSLVSTVKMDGTVDRLVMYHVEDNLRALETLGIETALCNALRRQLGRFHVNQIGTNFDKNMAMLSDLPEWVQLIDRYKVSIFKSLSQANQPWLLRATLTEQWKALDRKYAGGTLTKIYRRLFP